MQQCVQGGCSFLHPKLHRQDHTILAFQTAKPQAAITIIPPPQHTTLMISLLFGVLGNTKQQRRALQL
jgi:hypothetical protein